jgi:hypothetical protein
MFLGQSLHQLFLVVKIPLKATYEKIHRKEKVKEVKEGQKRT